jgi:hypothetical protein
MGRLKVTNPRPNAKAATRPGPIEGLVMMAFGALILGAAFVTQIDGYSPRDIARQILPGASSMAESDAGSVGL